MSCFNEENTVEQMVLDTLSGKDNQWTVAEPQTDYLSSHIALHATNLYWRFVAADDLPRQHSDVRRIGGPNRGTPYIPLSRERNEGTELV